MCNPALYAIGGGLGALQAHATHEAQKAQHEAAVGAYLGNIDESQKAKIEADRQINLNQAQEEEKAAQEKIANNLINRRTMAKGVQAQAETGAISNTGAIVQDMMRQGLMQNNMISANLARAGQQRQESRYIQEANYQSRINSVARPEWDSSSAIVNSVLAGVQTGGAAAAAGHSMKIGMKT